MSTGSLLPELRWAVEAAQNKKAAEVTLLDLRKLATFTDFFLLCTGFSSRQVQAISDEMEEQLARHGVRREHREGYDAGEWVLLDYGSFIVHIFNEPARHFYDLERLWRAAGRTEVPEAGRAARADASPDDTAAGASRQ